MRCYAILCVWICGICKKGKVERALGLWWGGEEGGGVETERLTQPLFLTREPNQTGYFVRQVGRKRVMLMLVNCFATVAMAVVMWEDYEVSFQALRRSGTTILEEMRSDRWMPMPDAPVACRYLGMCRHGGSGVGVGGQGGLGQLPGIGT